MRRPMVRACLPYSRSVEPMRSLRYSIRPPRNSMSMVPPSMVVSRETDFGVEGSRDRKSTRLNSSHGYISYAVFCLKKKKKKYTPIERSKQHTHRAETAHVRL